MRTLARRLGTTFAVVGILLVVYAGDGRLLARSGDEHLHRLRAARDELAAQRRRSMSWQQGARARARSVPADAARHARRRHVDARTVDSAAVLRSARRLALRFAAAETRPHRPAARAHPRSSGSGSRPSSSRTPTTGAASARARAATSRARSRASAQTTGHRGPPHDVRRAVPPHRQHPRSATRSSCEMPYGTFTYRVLRHQIVDNGDWSIMRKVGFDELVLSACHPLYSADQRYVVFARLANVKLAGASRGVNLPAARPRSDGGVGSGALSAGRSGRRARRPRSSPSPVGHERERVGDGRARELVREVGPEWLGAAPHDAHRTHAQALAGRGAAARSAAAGTSRARRRRLPPGGAAAGSSSSSSPTMTESGLPGSPTTTRPSRRPHQVGRPGCTARRQNSCSTPSAASAGLT